MITVQDIKEFAAGLKHGALPTPMDKLIAKWRGPDRSAWGLIQAWIVFAAVVAIAVVLVGALLGILFFS
jgi:hypothetical protein